MSKRLLTPLVALPAAVIALAALTLGLGAGTAGAATPTRMRTITVVGTGEVRGTPDVADLTLGVSGRGASAADVLRTIADRAQKVIDVLHGTGVADDDIQTRDLSVQPVLDDHGRITGYEATNTVTARIRDLRQAGGIVDAAADEAGDTIRVQGITFSIDDDSKLLAAARAKATKRARAMAEQLAGGAEVEVGSVQSISESTTAEPLTYSGEAADRAASTPVQPGSQTLSVSATVVFSIR
jgi:uncharacterized protein YggE